MCDRYVARDLLENARQVSGGVLSGTLGAPVDITTMLMRPLGYKQPDNRVIGSSEHLAGLLGLDTESTPYKVGSLLPTDATDLMKYGGLLGHIAYHGSPHKFDKFSMEKIGTGEGAQAYGHGLYFAESPEVARGYRDTLSADRPLDGFDHELGYGVKDKTTGAMNWYNSEKEAKYQAGKDGSLYKVDIADSAIPKMLDWDAPLSKQSPAVQDSIKKLWAEQRVYGDPTKLTGEGIHGSLVAHYTQAGMQKGGGKDAAAKDLMHYGIPGIKYKDAGSRGKDAGTHNYVLFDDNLVKILERQ